MCVHIYIYIDRCVCEIMHRIIQVLYNIMDIFICLFVCLFVCVCVCVCLFVCLFIHFKEK